MAKVIGCLVIEFFVGNPINFSSFFLLSNFYLQGEVKVI